MWMYQMTLISSTKWSQSKAGRFSRREKASPLEASRPRSRPASMRTLRTQYAHAAHLAAGGLRLLRVTVVEALSDACHCLLYACRVTAVESLLDACHCLLYACRSGLRARANRAQRGAHRGAHCAGPAAPRAAARVPLSSDASGAACSERRPRLPQPSPEPGQEAHVPRLLWLEGSLCRLYCPDVHTSPVYGSIWAGGDATHTPATTYLHVTGQEVMREPVVATDGHSYELHAISDVLRVGNGCAHIHGICMTYA